MRQKAAQRLRDALEDNTDPRSRVYAINTVLSADAHNLRREEFDDKRERLDLGRPTEIGSDRNSLASEASRLLGALSAVLENVATNGSRVAVENIAGRERGVRELEDRNGVGPCESQTD